MQPQVQPSQQQAQSQLHNDRDSDDGNPDHSADENDQETHPDEQSRSGKRKRPLSVSCELCKQRKVKCDRGQPSCGWCSRNGALCEYKERKKPGLRAGYGRELEQRLDRLEEVLRAHSEILQQSFGNGQQNHNRPPSALNSNPSITSDQGTPREAGPVIFRQNEPLRTPGQAETALFLQKPTLHPAPAPSQPTDFNLPPHTTAIHASHDNLPAPIAVSGVSPQHHHLPPLQPAPTTAQDFFAQQTQHLHSPTLNMSHSHAHVSPDKDLPPYDLLYSLADLYFKHVNTWCPILHRKATLDSLFGPGTLDETDRILLHAIVATTLRYSTDPRLTEDKRKHYHDISKQKVLLYGMENSSVKALQALVILALDLCGDGNGPPGWNIMALITRSVVQLGLAVETTSLTVSPNLKSIYTLRAMILPEPKDFIEEESRRRLFWMVYLLDRYATIATAFEFALDDREIDRTLPCRDDLWMKNQKVETRWFRTEEAIDPQPDHNDKPENLGAFSYYIEILGILSKIHKFLKQPVDISALADVERWQMRYKELDHTLASWKFGLPGEYGNMAKLFQPGSAKSLNCGWVMLHATYHTAVIRLHSSAAYPTHRSPIFQVSYTASQRCHQAVENIHALAEFAVTNGLLPKLGPPFAFTLWVAARLLLVHGSTVEHKLSPQISFLVDALREMGRYWPVARRYSELLNRVLDEQSDADRKGDGPPSSVRILADMRRTAFDLDFLISRAPRHNQFPGLLGPPGNGGGNGSRLASLTPQARTPAPNELEYLDVFDFFNVPRLPFGADLAANNGIDSTGNVEMTGAGPAVGEFNITNFTVDASSDWLFKQEGKFIA